MEPMESSAIAALVKYFNIVSIAVLALFAVFGAIVIFCGKSRINIIKNMALLSAFCVAVLAAFGLEATVFNFQRYLKLFAGPEHKIVEVSPENPNLYLTSGGKFAEFLTEKDQNGNVLSKIIFKDLNIKVTSVFLEAEFANTETGEISIEWTDEGGDGIHKLQKKLLKRLPMTNYTPLQSYGNVSELKIIFAELNIIDAYIGYSNVTLNKTIPFYISGLRLIIVSLLLFAAICLFRKEQRVKAAYYLFDYRFNPSDRKQNIVYALSIILLILFSYICINTSYSKSYFEFHTHQQYNKYLVDALAEGRTWLNYGNPENLLKAERPYDNAYRIANGYKFNTDVMWDWAWYKGKFYCYYGVVPAVILYLPYKLITGEYLSNGGGIFIFTSVIIILMAILWRFCVRKYMPDARFAFYILSYFTLFFASGMFVMLRFNRFYSVVQTAGLMFALAGCLLLLKSVENEKINRLKLFFACLCLALVVGCRPNMIFVSLLVPVILWRYRSWKLFLFVAIPYSIVAIPLCVYNYVRFDSIFEFGVRYSLTGGDISAFDKLNLFGKIIKTFWASACFLFTPNKYSMYFPFVECYPPPQGYGIINPGQPGCGMANFPIVFCLLYLFKNIIDKKQATQQEITFNSAQRVSLIFIIIAAIIAITTSFVMDFSGRYLLDFAVFVIIPSLFCAHHWYAGPDSMPQKEERLSVVLVLLTVSIFVGSFLCVSGTFTAENGAQVFYDPVLYRYLEYSLTFFREF